MKQKRRTDIYIAKLRKQSTHMKYKGTLVVVKDCRRTLRFYQDLFGFELTLEEMDQIAVLDRDEKHDWY